MLSLAALDVGVDILYKVAEKLNTLAVLLRNRKLELLLHGSDVIASVEPVGYANVTVEVGRRPQLSEAIANLFA